MIDRQPTSFFRSEDGLIRRFELAQVVKFARPFDTGFQSWLPGGAVAQRCPHPANRRTPYRQNMLGVGLRTEPARFPATMGKRFHALRDKVSHA
jgi:hypothetical protein